MIFFKKRKHKPLYKKFILSRKNVQNRKKIFKFKKQKWVKFTQYLKNQSSWKKRKPFTIYNFHVPKFLSLGNSFKRKFRNDLRAKKRFGLFYGNLKKKLLKASVKTILSKNSNRFNLMLLELFESRLDSVLYRTHFSSSIRNAQQMIVHGYVLVNKKEICKKSYILKKGDLVEINPVYSNVVKNSIQKIKKSKFWFWHIPPNYLIVKYKTLQIVFGEIKNFNFSNSFPFWLDTTSVLSGYSKS